METFVVIVGLLVAVGTPVSAYFATIRGHAVAERAANRTAQAALQTSETASRTALQAADLASRSAKEVASLASQTARREQTLTHLRWAFEKVTSERQSDQLLGVRIIKSLVVEHDLAVAEGRDDGRLDRSDLAVAVGALASFTGAAVDRAGDARAASLARPPAAGEA